MLVAGSGGKSWSYQNARYAAYSTMLVSGLMVAIETFLDASSSAPAYGTARYVWTLVYVSLSGAFNVLVTCMIAGRLWYVISLQRDPQRADDGPPKVDGAQGGTPEQGKRSDVHASYWSVD